MQRMQETLDDLQANFAQAQTTDATKRSDLKILCFTMSYVGVGMNYLTFLLLSEESFFAILHKANKEEIHV